MTAPAAAAAALYRALLTEATSWATDDAEDQEVLAAVDAAPTPGDKIQLLQHSSVVPSHLGSAVAQALAVLDPATYAPHTPPAAAHEDPAEHDWAFLALATVMVHSTAPTSQQARARVQDKAGDEMDAAAPAAGLHVSALTIEPGAVRLDQCDGTPVPATGQPPLGAPAGLLAPEVRDAVRDVVTYADEEKEKQDYTEQDAHGRAHHIYPSLRLLRTYLGERAA